MKARGAELSQRAAASGVANAAEELARLVSAQTVVRRDEPLARKTTLRVGGPADLYVEPATEADLRTVLLFCSERDLPLFVLGRGSNLLVKDAGFRGVVISLAQENFSRIDVCAQQLICGAGAKLKAVAFEAKRHDITGLEFLEGIPGSIGGALRMNAGAMGGATFEVVRMVRAMGRNGEVQELSPAEMDVHYRSCAALKSRIALAAVLQGMPGLRTEIEQRMSQFSRKRWESQPAAASAGCIFKNPTTIPAGKLIDELGLKGTRVGGAMVSLEHGNFLVNEANATAADVLALIELVRDRARARRGIELETEVQILGE
jgi:UDP-N-acetylenolpyruvoylglucosamine reductase